MSEQERLIHLFQNRKLTRRQFTRRALDAGLSLAMVSSLLEGGARTTSASPAVPPAATAKKGGVLISAVTTDAPGLDPQLVGALARIRMMAPVYDQLLGVSSEGQVIPWLAERWAMRDPHTWDFTLRRGVRWHNGDELGADDLAFTVQRWQTRSPFAKAISPVERVEVLDRHTARVITKTPFIPLPGVLAGRRAALVNRRTVEAAADGMLSRVANGTGPFMLEEWIPGQHLKLRRHPNYWDRDRILLDGITFQVVPDESTIIAGLRGGSIHHAQLEDNKNFFLVRGRPNLTVHRGPRFSYDWVNINTSKEPMDNVKVRQALWLAIDRERVMRAAAQSLAALSGNIPPSVKEWALPLGELQASLKTDKARAKALLAEAGYGSGLRVELLVISTFPTMVNSAQVLAADWRQIGVDVRIELVEVGVWLRRILRPGDYMMAMNLGFTGTDADEWLYDYFHSTGLNLNRWKDIEVDDLLDEGQRTALRVRRKEIYTKVQRLLLERVPQFPLFSADLINVTQSYVQGFVHRPTSFFDSLQYCWLDR